MVQSKLPNEVIIDKTNLDTIVVTHNIPLKDTPVPENNDTPNDNAQPSNDNSDYEIVSNDEMADHDDHSGHGHSHDVKPNDDTSSNALQSIMSSIFAIFLTL